MRRYLGLDSKQRMTLAKDRIPDELLNKIFPKRLNKSLSTEQIYLRLKKMIISGRLKKGRKLLQEEIAQDFRVSRVTAAKAFTRLKKDRLIISKRGRGSYIIWLSRNIWIYKFIPGLMSAYFLGKVVRVAILNG